MNDTLISIEEARRAHARPQRITRMKILGEYAPDDFFRARSGGPMHLLVRTSRDTCPKGPESFDNLDAGKLEMHDVVIISQTGTSFKCLVDGAPGVILRFDLTSRTRKRRSRTLRRQPGRPRQSTFWTIRLNPS